MFSIRKCTILELLFLVGGNFFVEKLCSLLLHFVRRFFQHLRILSNLSIFACRNPGRFEALRLQTRAIRRKLTPLEASRKTVKQHKKEVNFPNRPYAVKA